MLKVQLNLSVEQLNSPVPLYDLVVQLGIVTILTDAAHLIHVFLP